MANTIHCKSVVAGKGICGGKGKTVDTYPPNHANWSLVNCTKCLRFKGPANFFRGVK